MTPRQRRWIFLVAGAGLVAFYLWGLSGLPGFGHYPGPYGPAILRIAVAQTNATGVVSAINFDYRGFDTVGEEFILFVAAAGVATVLRPLRGERERSAVDEAGGRDVPPTSSAVRMVALLFTGPVVLIRAGVRQVLMLTIYGVLLAVLFLAFQAPDVTLSELVVGAVVLPVILLLTLAKVRKREQ